MVMQLPRQEQQPGSSIHAILGAIIPSEAVGVLLRLNYGTAVLSRYYWMLKKRLFIFRADHFRRSWIGKIMNMGLITKSRSCYCRICGLIARRVFI
jgi:hypothetical protein